MPSPGVRVTVIESLISDFGRVSERFGLWGMKLNEGKTKTMIVFSSRSMHCQSPPLNIGGAVMKESDDFDLLGVTFDSKMIFEKHISSVSRAASRRLGILSKSRRVFHDKLLLGRCFLGFVFRGLEYCTAMRCSAADTHLKLLNRVVSDARFLTGCVLESDIAHRRSVPVLYVLYKIRCMLMHPLHGAQPVPYVVVRVTRGALAAHRCTCTPPRCRSSQCRMTFIHCSLSVIVERYC